MSRDAGYQMWFETEVVMCPNRNTQVKKCTLTWQWLYFFAALVSVNFFLLGHVHCTRAITLTRSRGLSKNKMYGYFWKPVVFSIDFQKIKTNLYRLRVQGVF